jgi:betaine reductase
MISALPELAISVGAPRVVRGVRIEHVCGDPSLPPHEDAALRYRLVGRALEALRTPVEHPTIFELER